MIGRLQGILLEKQAPRLLIDVSGVGYEVDTPLSTFFNLPEIGSKITLFTHLVIREDQHTLYGFSAEAERRLFRALIKISGIGPKLALTILSGIRPEEFVRLVQANDAQALTRLPGVGKKTAERLLIEMRDKLEDLNLGYEKIDGDNVGQPISAPESAIREAVSALISLGYKPPEASRMVRAIPDKSTLSSEELIRQALQALG